LADWGANVVKVELPEHLDVGEALAGARHGPISRTCIATSAASRSTSSRGGSGNLSPARRKADVVVENFRPDVKTRLGIDYPR
jgi:formyl-CoA transferase